MHRWVEEYHVDGFRFDLAACLCRDPHGVPLSRPPVIEEISKDPVLSKVQIEAAVPASCSQAGAQPACSYIRQQREADRCCCCCMLPSTKSWQPLRNVICSSR